MSRSEGPRHTRIKFCGITRVDDALEAAHLGVDFIGLVCTRRSPRFVEPEQAREIVRALPAGPAVVTLFMDDPAEWVEQVERVLHPQVLQFHGRETDAWCSRFGTAHWKALAMGSAGDAQTMLAEHPHAAAVLLDGHAAGAQGGSGQCFDWSRIPAGLDRPWILAGGLDADSVGTALASVRPWAVDVSSGIEDRPGIKNPARMRAFVDAVRRADQVCA